MKTPLLRTSLLEKFTCLGEACPDTCCHGWAMPTDARQLALYAKNAPQLLAATDRVTGTMRRDTKTDYCLKLEQGSCSIHRQYGEEFLSDACHFYPRITRDLSGTQVMSAHLSCPEITRLALEEANPFAWRETLLDRLPTQLPQPLPKDMPWETARNSITAFQEYAEQPLPPETILAHIIHASLALNDLPPADWATKLPTLLQEALPQATRKASDPYALLYTLGVLLMRAPTTKRTRLEETIHAIESGLDCRLDWQNRSLQYGPNASQAWNNLRTRWNQQAAESLALPLRRWIQAQLSMQLWPFAGFADTTLTERTTILTVRFATVRLALMCKLQENDAAPDQSTIIATIQGISRFIDHLADAKLSRHLYHDAGWLNNETRLLGLVQ